MFIALSLISFQFASAKKTVRLGYFEGGSYFMHKVTMTELRNDLDRMAGDSIDIIYLPDAYQSARWDREICKAMSHDIVRNKNIDIVIAAGPWVIEDLLAAGFDRPIVGICQFDPMVMGLIDSTGKPIAKNLTVNYRPNKIKNDIAALERLFPSEKVGFLYFPSGDEFEKMRDKIYAETGKSGAVVYAGKEFSDRKLYTFFGSFAQIRSKIDVLYIAPMYGMELEQIRNFFWETQNARMPTFTSEGVLLLEKDATASDCFRPYRATSRFTADKIMKIIAGKEPASLPTIFDDREELCVNLESAAIVGAKISRKDLVNARIMPQLPGDTLPSYTLASAMDQAVRENAGYQARLQTYDRAVALAKGEYNSFLPSVGADLSAASTDNRTLATYYENIFNHEWQTGLSIEQTLFSYPAFKAVKIARKNMEIEKSNLGAAERDLKSAVMAAYVSILLNEEKLAALNDMTDHMRLISDDAEANLRIGLTSQNDTSIANEQLLDAKIAALNVERDLRLSKIIFNTLVNRPGNDEFVLDRNDFTPEIMAVLVKRLENFADNAATQKKFDDYLLGSGIDNSFEMKRADQSLDRQKDLVSAHKGRHWPELSLRGRYSYGEGLDRALNFDHDYWVFGGLLRIPIFDNKTNSREGQALRIEMDQMQYQKDSLRFSLMQEILSSSSNLFSHMRLLPLDYYSKGLAMSNLDSVQSQYNGDKNSISSLLEVEKTAAGSAIRAIDDRFQFFDDYFRLLNLIGVGYLKAGSAEERNFYQEVEKNIGSGK